MNGTREPWSFGVEPLDQARALAPLLRRVAGLVQALDEPHAAVDRLHAQLVVAEAELAAVAAEDPRPRVGDDPPAPGRPYVDHGADIGGYNPCFPEYELTVAGDRAHGTVTFPIVFEGPPGIVHGGVQATFFDCVMQEHNCAVGQAGKTTALRTRYRRPVPLATPLSFTVQREVADGRIVSTGSLVAGDAVLTTATMEAVVGDRDGLPSVSPRRTTPGRTA